MIGNILGNRYKILRELGAGGMAKVYMAEDINENQMVAVKVLYAHFGEDVSYLQRFIREAKMASVLNSPYIVKLLDYGSSRDVHYLIMEYVKGQDLREHLNKRHTLPWREVLSLIDQVCAALEEANKHNIVHRDIKPQNIMITENGILKILDFGIARARMLPSLTQSGFVGSPYYISPEQAMGEDVDIRSDIYSAGIVLYELLSGRVPFDAKSPWSIISKHISSDPPEINISHQAIPPNVQALLKRMLAKRPEDRFQNPAIVREAITSVLTDQEISEDLGPPPAADVDRAVMADSLYRRALEAIENDEWQKAVNLLNQTINLHPEHPEASDRLAEAGVQARLSALYKAAHRAMEGGRWREALDELTEIVEINPNYKDSSKLMVQARDTLNQSNAESELVELYKEAMEAFENGNYDHAEKLFGKIKQISPNYRRAGALWAESRRRSTSKGGFKRLSERLIKKEKPSLPLKWIAATALMVITIIALIFIISSISTPSDSTSPALDELFAQTQTAIEQNDIAKANQLLDQILELDPDNEEAATLKAQLSQEDILAEQLSQALSAIAAKEWTKAIEMLEGLRENPNFEPETVPALLCDAYLARGKERLAKIITPNDQATVRAALGDFIDGQQACEDHQELATQIAFASNYLSAIDNVNDNDTVINTLRPIVKAESNYAGGQAAQGLYQAYLNRGDKYQEAGNIESALEDYNAALALNVDDLSEAQTKQSLALQKLVATPTLPPAEATFTPISTATQEGVPETETVATPIQSSPAGFKYASPTLNTPPSFAEFAGEFTQITLSWEPIGLLADNEYYDVTIRYFVGNEARYWGSGLIKDTFWVVPREAGYGLAGKDEFSWWVTVRRSTGSGESIAISSPSEERTFFWRP